MSADRYDTVTGTAKGFEKRSCNSQ